MIPLSLRAAALLAFSLLLTPAFAQKDEGGLGGGGKTYDIDPGGINVIASITSDGTTVGNQSWLIDLSSTGSDYVQNSYMDLTGSTLELNIINTPLLNTYTIAYGFFGGGGGVTSGGASGIGQFASVTGMPVGYGIVYVENQARIVNLAVPEISTTLPLLGMLLPWFWSRRRR